LQVQIADLVQGKTENGDFNMKINSGVLMLFICAVTLGGVHFLGSEALAKESFFTSKGCRSCHTGQVNATCSGCHKHAGSLKAVTNKTTYAPGEAVKATLSSSGKGGWIRAILYNKAGDQLAISGGNASGMGHSTSLPATLTAPAPVAPGTYQWKMSWYGNTSNGGSGHGKITVNTNAFTVKVPDTIKPTLTISALADGANSSQNTLNISGNASDAGGLKSVTVNGKGVAVNAAGSFNTALRLATGANTVNITATDKAGNQQIESRIITYDPAVSIFTVLSPADNSSTAQSFVDLTGALNGTAMVTVKNNDASPENASINGASFTSTANLAPGVNTIIITASDLSGNSASAKRTINYDSGAMTLGVTSPNQDITTSKASIVLSGAVADAIGNVAIRITMNGTVLPPPTVTNGTFRKKLNFTQARKYAITVTATDTAGNKSTATRNVIYRLP
jgi:hypothetical protein